MAAAALHVSGLKCVLTMYAAVLSVGAVRRHEAFARRMSALLDFLHNSLPDPCSLDYVVVYDAIDQPLSRSCAAIDA